MKASELAAIREDLDRATVEAYLNGDPQLLPDVVNRLLGFVGNLATVDIPDDHAYPVVTVRTWADQLLRDVQTRAISRIPYAEAPDDDPEDHRDQP